METTNALQVKERESKLIIFSAEKQFMACNEYKMNFNREASFAIQLMMSNPALIKCDPDTIRHAVVNVALTGLTLNPALHYCYLIPRKGKCILDISYIGMIKILTDAGSVKNIEADVICQNDKFDYRKGSDPYFKHVPVLSNRGEIIGSYALAFFRDNGFQFEILGRDEIEKVRATSESYANEQARKYSPWEVWFSEMAKKTALKRLFKLLPKTQFSEQLIAAISHDYDNEMDDLKPQEDKYAKLFDEAQEATVIKDSPVKAKQERKKAKLETETVSPVIEETENPEPEDIQFEKLFPGE
jgi:recombination protein RecT